MAKAYLILQGYDKHLSLRYRLYHLNTTFTHEKVISITNSITLKLTDDNGKDFFLKEISETNLIIYGRSVIVEDQERSSSIVMNLEHLIETRKEAICSSLENSLHYNNLTKAMELPKDPFLERE